MQRRWAAVCIAFFLVMGASAFSVMALAEEPTVSVEGQQYQNDSTLQANGQTYTVLVDNGTGTLVTSTTVEMETTFQNNTEVEYRNATYNVSIAPGNDTSSFTLEEVFDVEAVLAEDPSVQNSTFTRDDGTEAVVYRNGTTQPLSEYLPEPDRETFAAGDSLEHDNVTKTVDSVSSSEVVLTWEEEGSQSVSFGEGDVVELGDSEYVVTFVDNDTVMLSTDRTGYEEVQNARQEFQQRMTGLLYVVVLSLGFGIILAALAFLPRRG